MASIKKGDIFAEVYLQIEKDVYVDDYTAIYELIKDINKEKLMSYLSDDIRQKLEEK